MPGTMVLLRSETKASNFSLVNYERIAELFHLQKNQRERRDSKMSRRDVSFLYCAQSNIPSCKIYSSNIPFTDPFFTEKGILVNSSLSEKSWAYKARFVAHSNVVLVAKVLAKPPLTKEGSSRQWLRLFLQVLVLTKLGILAGMFCKFLLLCFSDLGIFRFVSLVIQLLVSGCS